MLKVIFGVVLTVFLQFFKNFMYIPKQRQQLHYFVTCLGRREHNELTAWSVILGKLI